MAKFVHLHCHSEFSLLDGLAKIPDMLSRAKELGMESIALTDHGAMYGAVKFFKTAKQLEVKPIIGVETYVAKRSRFDKEGKIDNDSYHLVLLAKNQTGYKNLLKLVSHAHLEGFYYKPRIDLEVLEKHHDGLIALSACLAGEIPNLLIHGEEKKAKEKALYYAELFGQGNFYLEIQKHPKIREQDIANEKIIKLSKELGIPLIATNDSHYVNPDDAEAQEVLLCVQTQKTLLEKNRPLSMINSPDFYIKTPDEMTQLFIEHEEAIDNSIKISRMCDTEIEIGKWILPKFPVPDDENPNTFLKKLCEERIKKRYEVITDEINNRLQYELSIIEKKNYATYFLIVGDFVNWAKENNIAVGPGRGSAAGSVVAYAMGITGIDPFYFKLPFERFLNPQRPSPPDIDLDFADDRRDKVIEYVTKKYGNDRVAQIITFGTMEARQSIRDVGRVLGMPYSGPDRIAKMIPPGAQGFQMTIDRALQSSPELSFAYHNEPETKRLLELAIKLEGVTRHASTHAAGVVIADKPLTDYVPLQKEVKGEKIITQYDMYSVGEDGIGLLKMDFLGLRNLTILQQALSFIRDTENIRIDLAKLPLDDGKTYKLLASGDTTGIFQLESSGMRRYIKELRPTTIFDVMAMVALFRPGPMLVIPEFIARKHNRDLISYPDPRLKDVLKQSYGLIAYQDDVLLTSIVLAGYSWGEADKLRKAVGKKIPLEMKKQKEKFIDGCIKNGLKKVKAEEIFKLIEPFAGYGFNKAHAACYAVIAYQTAYLKAHYPVEFMAALLTAESRSNGPTRDEKLARAIEECKSMKITVVPPNINKSDLNFTIEKKDNIKNIRFGLSAIKNVGPAAIETIINSRNEKGEFKNINDFCHRVDLSKVNKKTLESLIKAGAMDAFGKRSALLAGVVNIIEESHKLQKQISSGQTSLFDSAENKEIGDISSNDIKLEEMEELAKEQLLSFEKELLGFYLTEHPFGKILSDLSNHTTHKISEINHEDHAGKKVTIGGMVSQVKKILTKQGNNEMAFVILEDLTGKIEVIVFPKIYNISKDYWTSDKIVLIKGKVNDREDRLSIIVESVSDVPKISDNNNAFTENFPFEDNILQNNKTIRIKKNTKKEKLSELNNLLRENPGDDKITIIIENDEEEKHISLNFGINFSKELSNRIDELLKEEIE